MKRIIVSALLFFSIILNALEQDTSSIGSWSAQMIQEKIIYMFEENTISVWQIDDSDIDLKVQTIPDELIRDQLRSYENSFEIEEFRTSNKFIFTS